MFALRQTYRLARRNVSRMSTASRLLRLDVSKSSTSRSARVKLSGEFDLSEVQSFRETVTAGLVQDGHATVVLDLSGLTFLDSSGLRALLEARRSALLLGSRLVLLRPSEAVQKVLFLSGLADVFEIADDDGGLAD